MLSIAFYGGPRGKQHVIHCRVYISISEYYEYCRFLKSTSIVHSVYQRHSGDWHDQYGGNWFDHFSVKWECEH